MAIDPAGTPSRAAIEQEIAEAVALALGDTGWLPLTHEGTSGTLRYRVIASLVFVEASVTISIPANATVAVLTAANALPIGRRPSMSINLVSARLSANTTGLIQRFADGTINVVNPTGAASTSVQFAYTYPVG